MHIRSREHVWQPHLNMVLPDSQPAQLPTLPEFAPPTDVDASAVATAFLDQVEKAISARDAPVFQSLFTQWGYWRDVLSFTGEFHTFKTAQIGAAAKVGYMLHNC